MFDEQMKRILLMGGVVLAATLAAWRAWISYDAYEDKRQWTMAANILCQLRGYIADYQQGHNSDLPAITDLSDWQKAKISVTQSIWREMWERVEYALPTHLSPTSVVARIRLGRHGQVVLAANGAIFRSKE